MIKQKICFLVLLFIAISSISADPKTDRLQAWLDAYQAEAHVPGVAAVVLDGQSPAIQLSSGGLSVNKPLGVGHITQVFTALGIAKLLDQGKLKPEQKVVAILPWFRLADAQSSAQITIQMLLDQTSGIPDDYEYVYNTNSRPDALESSLRNLQAMVAVAEPGTLYFPSHYNYDLLGQIISTITGQAFAPWMEATILKPMGLTQTALSPDKIQALKPATGNFIHVYNYSPAPLYQRPVVAPSLGTMVASAADLGRLIQNFALSPVSQRSIDYLLTDRVLVPMSPYKGLGTGADERGASCFRVAKVDGRTLYLLYGYTTYTSSLILFDRDQGRAVAITCNYEASHLDIYRYTPIINVAYNLLRLSEGQTMSNWARPVKSDPLMQEKVIAEPSEFTKYLPLRAIGQHGDMIKISLDGGKIIAEHNKAGRVYRFRMLCFTPNRAVSDSLMYRSTIHLLYGPDGRPSALKVNGNHYDFLYQRMPQGYHVVQIPGGGSICLPINMQANASTFICPDGTQLEFLDTLPPAPQGLIRNTKLVVQELAGFSVSQLSYSLGNGFVETQFQAKSDSQTITFRLRSLASKTSQDFGQIILPLFRYSQF